jgi:hypothetical protein
MNVSSLPIVLNVYVCKLQITLANFQIEESYSISWTKKETSTN